MTSTKLESASPASATPEPSSGTTVDMLISLIRNNQALRDDEVVVPDDKLSVALGIDSLDALEFFLDLEDVLDRELQNIQDAARAQWKKITVRGLADLLDGECADQS